MAQGKQNNGKARALEGRLFEILIPGEGSLVVAEDAVVLQEDSLGDSYRTAKIVPVYTTSDGFD